MIAKARNNIVPAAKQIIEKLIDCNRSKTAPIAIRIAAPPKPISQPDESGGRFAAGVGV